ncbi:MAG: YgiT-type zinc finger protein [Pyrinomonadaceae bacterium]
MPNSTKKHFHCDFCEGITQTKIIDYTLKRFGREFLLKDIKAEVCPNCDKAYLPGPTLKEAEEKIKKEMALETA